MLFHVIMIAGLALSSIALFMFVVAAVGLWIDDLDRTNQLLILGVGLVWAFCFLWFKGW